MGIRITLGRVAFSSLVDVLFPVILCSLSPKFKIPLATFFSGQKIPFLRIAFSSLKGPYIIRTLLLFDCW